ncbi:MAG TPA: FHA domain-containing protein [Phycisphaeraceae bacterium]
MNVSLVMFKADGTRREFPLTRPRTVIGRKNTCDLRIPLSSVSRQHCEIQLDGEQALLRDLGSSNGTFHNSQRVQEVVLAPGDEIVIGPVIFTVTIDGEPQQIKPVRTILDSEAYEPPPPTPRPADPAQADEHEIDPAGQSASTLDLDDPIAELEQMAAAEASQQDPLSDDDLLLMPDDEEERSA